MNQKSFMTLVAALSVVCVLAFATVGQAATIIGTWDGSDDGWIDWNDGDIDAIGAPKWTYATVGGKPALKLTDSGWEQTLAVNLNSIGYKDAFLANRKLLIDLTAPATTQSGWLKIEKIGLNAQGIGFEEIAVTEPAFFGWGDGGGGAQSATLELGYLSYLNTVVPTLDLGAGQPWWVEFIVTTNNDGVHTEFFFQNARLVVPEPASLVLLGLGLIGLVCCRRR